MADWDKVVKKAGDEIFTRKIQETAKRIDSFEKENIHNYQQDTKSQLRFRVLRHMKSIFWEKFQKGEASAQGIKILEEAVNMRLEDTNTPINSLWEIVESNFANFGSIKFWYSLKDMLFCGTIARGYISRHLLFVLETSTTFMEAMVQSSKLVTNVDIEEEIKRGIKNEIDEETDKAELKLIELSEQFPEIISSIETKRVATLILNRQKNRALEMSKSGFIDEQDYQIIRREIDQYFSKIENKQPKWKSHDVNVNFVGQPIFSCLRKEDVDRIAGTVRTIIKQANTTIYMPGTAPEYLYIVSKGTVEERIEGENPRTI